MIPKLDTIPRQIVVGRNATAASPDEVVETSAGVVATVVATLVNPADVEEKEALACIRVRIVSIGWIARVEIPPEIQPAVKSIQDDSLDII